MEANKVIKYPLSTEKSIRLMEAENKLLFVVDKAAKKADIKKAVETLFRAKAVKINTFTSQRGEKRAYIKFSPDTRAIDIATQLGLI